MEEIRTRLGDVDLSYDWKQYYRREVDRIIMGKLREKAKREGLKIENIIDERVNRILELTLEEAVRFIERHGLPKVNSIRMLFAHGNSWKDNNRTDFVYHEVNEDGTDYCNKVQDWLNLHDGKYEALFVQSCNPAGVEVDTQHSLLIYPQDVNDSKEILFASYGLGKKVLVVKTPKNYTGRKSVIDSMGQMPVLLSY